MDVPRSAARSAQRGVGIIEVLIALVVVSLGVLGVAGLQLTGMQHSTGGFNRSKALLYAEDMASRMRLNRAAFDGAAAGLAYDGHDSSTGGYCAVFAGPVCDERSGSAAQACDASELAAFDLYSVSCGVDGDGGVAGSDLPNGVLTVNCDAPCAAGSTWTIAVDWREGNAVADVDTVDERRVQMRLRP